MRIPILLLGVSLIANAALFILRPTSDAAPASSASPLSPSASHPAAPITPALLAQLESGDPAALEKLRALDLPEPLRIALIRAMVDQTFEPRYRALSPSNKNYWETSIAFGSAYAKERTAIEQEKDTLLKKLLGDAHTPTPTRDPELAFLSPEKATLVQRIDKDYRALATENQPDNPFGPTLPVDKAALDLLATERRADLAAILTPEELRAYDLRQSPTATRLRRDLDAFEPTEAEFSALYDLALAAAQKAGINPHAVSRGIDINASQALRKAEEASAAEAKALLGESRYNDLVRSRDYDYQTLSKIGQRYNLPKETQIAAHDLSKTYQQRARDLAKDPANRDPQKRAEANQLLAREAESQLTQLLGANGAQVYKENSSLFRRLNPPPTTSTSSNPVLIPSTSTTPIIITR